MILGEIIVLCYETLNQLWHLIILILDGASPCGVLSFHISTSDFKNGTNLQGLGPIMVGFILLLYSFSCTNIKPLNFFYQITFQQSPGFCNFITAFSQLCDSFLLLLLFFFLPEKLNLFDEMAQTQQKVNWQKKKNADQEVSFWTLRNI